MGSVVLLSGERYPSISDGILVPAITGTSAGGAFLIQLTLPPYWTDNPKALASVNARRQERIHR
jgi:hypothetical protein